MPQTEEDIAWLRSTFHPVPRPALPDDCIEYYLYIFDSSIDQTNPSGSRLQLLEVRKHVNDLQKQWLKDYIWQRQSFNLDLLKENGEVCVLKEGRTTKEGLICLRPKRAPWSNGIRRFD